MGGRSGYIKSTGEKINGIGTEEKVPPELKILADKWAEIAKHTDFQPEWYVKHANIVFKYKGIWYELSPGRLETSQELFEWLSGKIEEDLIALDAEDIFYRGMID